MADPQIKRLTVELAETNARLARLEAAFERHSERLLAYLSEASRKKQAEDTASDFFGPSLSDPGNA